MVNRNKSFLSQLLIVICLILVLTIGGYLRIVGLDWDEEQHLHPDERFLTMVETSLEPVKSLTDYFDTETSTLNPGNQGHGFFVYGTLPIFIVRYVADGIGQAGYGEVYLIGRVLSAFSDVLTIFVVFMLGTRLFNQRVGLLAATFSAFAVLQIQQSHFFTVDTFTTFFMLLALYFAVEVSTSSGDEVKISSYILFGLALGMGVASKVNAAPVAITLPLAALIYLMRKTPEKRYLLLPRVFVYLLIAALLSLITFRVFQPYAFRGTSFFNFGLNQNWISSLRSLRAQSAGDVDFPPALQWARRPVWFSLKNMVLWGLGVPYGILTWAGFLIMGWKLFTKKIWKPELMIWIWTAIYFVWQSLLWNSTMRYQLPIYPLLGIFAGWLLIKLWDRAKDTHVQFWNWTISPPVLKTLIIGSGIIAVLMTAGWAYSFSRIYTKPHPRVAATRWIFENAPGPATLIINTEEGQRQQLVSYPQGTNIERDASWLVSFASKQGGTLSSVFFPEIRNENQNVNPVTLEVSLKDHNDVLLGSQTSLISFVGGESTGQIDFGEPIALVQGDIYLLQISVKESGASISLHGTGIANESTWDDGLPLRMDGYDPFGGIYKGGLNFEMYWEDNPEKLDRFISTLDQAEYLIISSSRQWATTTRVPERYPLTTEYYRQLVGCPINISVENCYNRALPGMFQGNLGFDLIQTFQSNPTLGSLEFNDQPSEEAFTVYDHPKVFIFKKSPQFDLEKTAELLGKVDLSKVIHITPKQADSHPRDLMLPLARWEKQQAGGTWSDLFNPNAIYNRNQFTAAVIWYFAVFLLGVIVYPLIRFVLSGLRDGGYPIARIFGMLLLSYLVWLGGSVGIQTRRSMILGVLLIITAGGVLTGYLQREELRSEWDKRKKYLLVIEILAIALFVLALVIRLGNPDLWHPWKGGEKPMDFSYFNAVLKSTTFPPYDPWFSGGYINYYYYGFVFIGVLVKLLGIIPALAYNLILPTLFMFLGLGAFSLVWNVLEDNQEFDEGRWGLPTLAGGIGVLGMIVVGNLGILRMIFQGLQRLASGGVDVLSANFFQRFVWTLLGIVQLFQGNFFNYRIDEWYWNPSRIIGAEHGGPITEFPFFTFLYGDPHAHFIALPITLLAFAWVLSIVISAGRDQKQTPGFGRLIGLSLFGSLVVGVLKPTNTWDFYTYLAFGVTAFGYTIWKETTAENGNWIRPAIQLILFVSFSYILFKPYADWYGQGYTSIKAWYASKTPLNDYFMHWGLFLFVIFSWMVSETIDWMATTPVSALGSLKKYRELILAGILILLVVMISLGISLEDPVELKGFTIIGSGVHIVWFVLPLMTWAGILLFRPGNPHAKQIVLFMIGTGLAITLMVELIYVEGDIGRMNTVFKFYLQVWTIFAIAAAACLGWLIPSLKNWNPGFKFVWKIAFYALVTGAALYPLLGGIAKIKDRMAMDAPHTLDGMAYMAYSEYMDYGTTFDLSQDYRAIRWMQDNIEGSPVIVEANQVEYHWATRYTVYTGLPGVLGWNWHQRQQRTTTPHDWIYERVDDINMFYDTEDLGFARDFLIKYQVQYIVLGQLERAKYLPEGIEKFKAAEGVLWEPVYQDQETTIYHTLTTY